MIIGQKKKFYTNGQITIKLSENDSIPEGFYKGRTFKSNPWNRGLTSLTDDRVKQNAEKCHNTRRIKNNYISWNTGLTKDVNDSLKLVSEKLSIYRKNNPMSKEQKDQMCIHIDETKRKNNSFTKSKPEEDYYNYLLTLYSIDDIIRQYKDIERYPFNCDFYIKSKDLFIECNYSWCHGKHPYNPNDINDQNLYKIKLEKSQTSKYHKYALKIWAEVDPLKLETFRKNKLNFMIIYGDGLIIDK